jgi:hypothetical protein
MIQKTIKGLKRNELNISCAWAGILCAAGILRMQLAAGFFSRPPHFDQLRDD